MAHNINTYIGRQAAWHKLGKVTGRFMTSSELLADRGLNYVPEKLQLTNPLTGALMQSWGIFRPDTKAFLGNVGELYTVIDHAQGFHLSDALIGQQDGAHYETAGCLGDGEVVWALANLNMSISVGDDKTTTYLLFATSHNGTITHLYRITGTRVVCQNTLNIALSSKAAAMFSIRHTAGAQKKLDQAHMILATLGSEVKSMEEKLNMLAKRMMTKETTTAILDRLFPQRKNADGVAIDSTRRTNIINDVLTCYEINDKNAFPEQRGTAYNLLNAVTEYTDHLRSTRKDDSGESAMFGSGDKLKTKALEVILETANGLPIVSQTIYAPAAPNAVSFGILDDIIDASIN